MAEVSPEVNARLFLQEIKKRLISVEDEQEFTNFLKNLIDFLSGNGSHCQFPLLDSSAKKIFLERYYPNIIEHLLGLATQPWYSKFKKEQTCSDLLLHPSKEGDAEDVFLNLVVVLDKARNTNIIKECIWLLEKFIEDQKFADILWKQAKILPAMRMRTGIFEYEHSLHLHWNELIKRVTSLPDKVSNVYKLPKSSLLWPHNYFIMIGKILMKVLKSVHTAITASNDCSLEFLSQLMAKICVLNHGDDTYSVVLPEIEKLVQTSPLWCRICHKLFTSVSESSIEPVITALLKKCGSYELLYQLLGDVRSISNSRMKFLMTHKLLLYRSFVEDRISYCIIGYLSKCSSEKEDLLVETMKKLIGAWGDANAIKHASSEQHLYITKCILLAIGFLRERYKNQPIPEQLGTALTMKLLEALPPHLESPIENFRYLGMVVAEQITSLSKIEGVQSLKFDFQRNDEVCYLSSIADDPSIALSRSKDINKDTRISSERESNEVADGQSLENSSNTQNMTRIDLDLDSDDDLEPYSIDDDEDDAVAGVRPPVYLRDCMSGLLSNDDPSRFEASLTVAEKLVRREPSELPEVAVELVKILLYLQDNYNTANFITLRHEAMVAVATRCPKPVVEYLTAEFYNENYNLRQRMDMLGVISASAQELSQPLEHKPRSLRKHLPLPKIPGIASHEKPDWQLVVEERIKSKTRVISRGRQNAEPVPVANRFGAVAGDFFFPLLKNFDSKCNTFDLLGKDFVVLGKLIHTLGSIVQASSGLSIARLMTSTMLDFIWGLRYHREPFIRQALLYATSMCLLSCPTHNLVTELNSELIESHGWVTDVVNNDPDTDCRKLALQTLLLLDGAIKNEFS